MSGKTTKSIRNIEEKMEEMDPSSIRYQVLNNVRNFKTSWIELGQLLYGVWKDKLYKDWGYSEFETYVSKEIGIQKLTALKLLRSYSFLEKEEPLYLKKEHNENADAAAVPVYESVDVLRRAKNNKDIDEKDYSRIRKYVLEEGKSEKEVKKDLAQIIKQQEENDPDEAREKKRMTVLKRFLGILKALNTEIKVTKMLPDKIVKETDELIKKLEFELK